jgi:hypothetical protein
MSVESPEAEMKDGPVSSVPPRPWRVIAQELSVQLDHAKISQLVEELNRAFDEQTGTTTRLADEHASPTRKPTDNP